MAGFLSHRKRHRFDQVLANALEIGNSNPLTVLQIQRLVTENCLALSLEKNTRMSLNTFSQLNVIGFLSCQIYFTNVPTEVKILLLAELAWDSQIQSQASPPSQECE
jgi:hypothetical protein